MWIMLTKKLPTVPSPPRLSIFWSTPWPDMKEVKRQYRRVYFEFRENESDECAFRRLVSTEDKLWDGRGWEHNWNLARKIVYDGKEIRVFPNEFSVLKPENMRMYVFGVDGGNNASHELIADSVAEDELIKGVLDGETRPIYEAAMMDGASHAQALTVALGKDITLPDFEFPPLGWYRCRREYAEYYCEEWEMEEVKSDDPRGKVPIRMREAVLPFMEPSLSLDQESAE